MPAAQRMLKGGLGEEGSRTGDKSGGSDQRKLGGVTGQLGLEEVWGGVSSWAEADEPDWLGMRVGGGRRQRDKAVRAERAIAEKVFFHWLRLGWTRWLGGECRVPARLRLTGVLGGGSSGSKDWTEILLLGDNTAVAELLLLSCQGGWGLSWAGPGREADPGTIFRLW